MDQHGIHRDLGQTRATGTQFLGIHDQAKNLDSQFRALCQQACEAAGAEPDGTEINKTVRDIEERTLPAARRWQELAAITGIGLKNNAETTQNTDESLIQKFEQPRGR